LDPFSVPSGRASTLSLQQLVYNVLRNFLKRLGFRMRRLCMCMDGDIGPIFWFSACGATFVKLESIPFTSGGATVEREVRSTVRRWVHACLRAGVKQSFSFGAASAANQNVLREWADRQVLQFKSSFTVFCPGVFMNLGEKQSFIALLHTATLAVTPNVPLGFYDANDAALLSWRLWNNDKYTKLKFAPGPGRVSFMYVPCCRPLRLVHIHMNEFRPVFSPAAILPLLSLNRVFLDMKVKLVAYKRQYGPVVVEGLEKYVLTQHLPTSSSTIASLISGGWSTRRLYMRCVAVELDRIRSGSSVFQTEARETLLTYNNTTAARCKRSRSGAPLVPVSMKEEDLVAILARIDATLCRFEPYSSTAAYDARRKLIWQRFGDPLGDKPSISSVFPSGTVACPLSKRVHASNRLCVQVQMYGNWRIFLRCFDQDCKGQFMECA